MGGGDNTINGLLLIGENTMERIQRRFTRMLMDLFCEEIEYGRFVSPAAKGGKRQYDGAISN